VNRVKNGIWLLVIGLSVSSCEKPGLRGDGTSVVVAGEAAIRWEGTCEYSVSTRWATALPHVLRLQDESSRSAIVISRRSAWSAGRTEFPTGENRALLGLALDGATVDGGILGSLEISRSGDSLFAVVHGHIAGRDTVPLEASCRIGPLTE
jgi:hypothetical protein